MSGEKCPPRASFVVFPQSCWFTDCSLNNLEKEEKGGITEKGHTVLDSVPVTLLLRFPQSPSLWPLYCAAAYTVQGWAGRCRMAPLQHRSLTLQAAQGQLGDKGSGAKLALASGLLGVPSLGPLLGSPIITTGWPLILLC